MFKAPNVQLPHPAPRALAALRSSILPALEDAQSCGISLVEPPFRLAAGIDVELKPGKPLALQSAVKGLFSSTGLARVQRAHYAVPVSGLCHQGTH